MWKTVKLSEVCEIQPPKKEVLHTLADDSEVSFMGMNLLGIDKVDARTAEVRSLSAVYKAYTYFAENDVLLAKITPCFENGKLGLAKGLKNGVGFGSSEFIVFRCKEILEPKFLYYFLNQKGFREEGKRNMSGAVGHKRVTKEFIANTLLPLPPLAEQQRIVARLDATFEEIDKAIYKTEYASQQSLSIYQKALGELFGSIEETEPRKTLRDISSDFGRGKSKHRPRNDERLYGNIMPFIQTGNVSNAELYINSYDKCYSEFGVRQSKVWKKGTVCITIAANIAELAILDMDACFPDSVIGVFPNEEITSPKYVFYLLNYFQGYIKRKSKGSAQQNINLGTFESEKFPFPKDLNRQEKIVEKLNTLQKHLRIYQSMQNEKSKELDNLKSAILAQELKSEAA